MRYPQFLKYVSVMSHLSVKCQIMLVIVGSVDGVSFIP